MGTRSPSRTGLLIFATRLLFLFPLDECIFDGSSIRPRRGGTSGWMADEEAGELASMKPSGGKQEGRGGREGKGKEAQ